MGEVKKRQKILLIWFLFWLALINAASAVAAIQPDYLDKSKIQPIVGDVMPISDHPLAQESASTLASSSSLNADPAANNAFNGTSSNLTLNRNNQSSHDINLSSRDLGLNGPVTLNKDAVSFSSQDLFLNEPFSIAGQFSRQGGYMLYGQLVEPFGADNAIAMALDTGRDERRFALTYGRALTDLQRIKTTAEYLTQKRNFDFLTDDASTWIGQFAYGLEYQYIIPNNIVNAIDVGGVYSSAASKDLATVFRSRDGYYLADYRHIAGGEDKRVNIGVDLLPAVSTLISTKLDYDNVHYRTKYLEHNQDTSGFGASIDVTQLLGKKIKINVSASDLQPYDLYQTSLAWLLKARHGEQIEMSLFGRYMLGKGMLQNDADVGLSLNYKFGGESAAPDDYYSLGVHQANFDLAQWTTAPAVHMPVVLAIKDELIKEIFLQGLEPNYGPLGGGTAVLISGKGFDDKAGPPTIKFGTRYAAAVSILNDTQITATTPSQDVPGMVDIILSKANGGEVKLSNAFNYISGNSPVITSLSSDNGLVGGGIKTITISGKNFIDVTSVTIGNVSATFTWISDAQINITSIPAHPLGSCDVVVTTRNGGSSPTSDATKFIYNGIEEFSSPGLSDNSAVIIATNGMVPLNSANESIFTSNVKVTVKDNQSGVVADAKVSAVENNKITIEIPEILRVAQHASNVHGTMETITVTNNNGAGDTAVLEFEHNKSAPQITSITRNGQPSAIALTGGGKLPNEQKIIIYGKHFNRTTADSYVKIAGKNVSFSVVNDAEIEVTEVPPHAAGAVEVTVGNANGEDTKRSALSYVNVPYTFIPYDRAIGKQVAAVDGGDILKIEPGLSFKLASRAQVFFDSVNGKVEHVNNTLKITTPALNYGEHKVKLVNGNADGAEYALISGKSERGDQIFDERGLHYQRVYLECPEAGENAVCPSWHPDINNGYNIFTTSATDAECHPGQPYKKFSRAHYSLTNGKHKFYCIYNSTQLNVSIAVESIEATVPNAQDIAFRDSSKINCTGSPSNCRFYYTVLNHL